MNLRTEVLFYKRDSTIEKQIRIARLAEGLSTLYYDWLRSLNSEKG